MTQTDSFDKSPINVFLIGNNPSELGGIYQSLQNFTKRKLITEFAFDLKNILIKVIKFSPGFILVDDKLTSGQLKILIRSLSNNKKTKEIPIALMKSSNYSEVITHGFSDFILKESLSADRIYTAILNSIKFRKSRKYLYKIYKKQAGYLSGFFRRNIYK